MSGGRTKHVTQPFLSFSALVALADQDIKSLVQQSRAYGQSIETTHFLTGWMYGIEALPSVSLPIAVAGNDTFLSHYPLSSRLFLSNLSKPAVNEQRPWLTPWCWAAHYEM